MDHDDHVPVALDPLTVNAGQRIDEIEVQLRGVGVKGRVLSVRGRSPMAKVQVYVARVEGQPDCWRNAITLEDGSFSLSGLAENEYLV